MKPHEISLRQQLVRIIMLTSSIVLLLSSAAFIGFEWVTLRQTALESLATLGKVIADNSAAPLAFSNPVDAEEVLSALKADPHVRQAVLYDRSGHLFATFPRGLDTNNIPPVPEHLGQEFGNLRLRLTAPVVQKGAILGTLLIESDLGGILARLRLYAAGALLILASALFMAFFFSRVLQQRVSGPILALAETARNVSERGDYSVRAEKLAGGEPGVLTEAFNRMLDEIQQRQEALRASEERFRSMADNIAQLAWIADPSGFIGWYNQRWFDYTGTTLKEMEGWGWQKVHHPDHLQRVIDKWRQSLERGLTWEDTFPLRGRDGQFRWFLSRAVPIRDEQGKVVRWFGTNTDVTEQRQTQEELQRFKNELEQRVQERTAALAEANRELEAFGYSVSHDLRAPLRHVSSFIRLLSTTAGPSLDENSRRHIQVIADAARKMGNLIDDLLVLSRLGRATMTETTFSMTELADEARRELEPELVERSVHWQIGRLPAVRADRALLRSAVVNLLSNAIKYTKGKEPAEIQVEAQAQADEVVFLVRDNGAGFDMRFVGKLFGVFQRLHRSEDFPGTGIGLASVRRVIQRHGGRTWATAEVGRGATFYFSLPKARVFWERSEKPSNPGPGNDLQTAAPKTNS
ncbi:MAG TPA: ATP-binding protein [Verrucomicrobiae bacterium]|nr:ATP-binding protein [Verrucomicrobiae bacterium]